MTALTAQKLERLCCDDWCLWSPRGRRTASCAENESLCSGRRLMTFCNLDWPGLVRLVGMVGK